MRTPCTLPLDPPLIITNNEEQVGAGEAEQILWETVNKTVACGYQNKHQTFRIARRGLISGHRF